MVEQLIQRARRRLLLNETLGQAAFACAVLVGGFALILLAGTRYLEWWTLALFAVIGVVGGIVRGSRNAPSRYVAAMKLDAGANLNDAISTALHFQAAPAPSAEYQEAQRRQAETAAGGVVVEHVIPFTRPAAAWALVGLTAFAAVLIGLRFTSGHGLDLSRPITEVLFEDQAAQRIAKKGYMDPARRAKMETAESLLAKLGNPVNPDDKGDPEAALDKAIQDALEGNNPAAGQQGGDNKGKGGKPEDGKQGNGLSQEAAGDPMSDKKDGGEQASDKQQQGGKEAGAGDKKGSNSGGDKGSQSLMSKLKDAVKDLMNKASKPGNSGEKGEQGQQSAKSENGDKGSSGKSQQQQQGQQSAENQSGEPSSDGQEGQQQEGKSASKSAQASSQSGSGMGSQDGAKEFHAAEQMKAMGKISEIIGNRAKTVSGETSIEVQSGNQQLRTSYTSKQAKHGEADSDVARDEIPVPLHSYVQQYFEQVRKAAQPKGKAAEPNK